MPGELQVDIEGLRNLGSALTGIRQDLGDLGADFGMYDCVLGAAAVKHQLSEVAGNWKKSRQRISGELEALARMVEMAAGQYAAIEAEISRAFCPPGSAGPAASSSGG
ncbi:MAG TPA: hypothetical protein VHL53_04600 [Acidimicrobiia bacterium]|nr:hypothetical protein [Acidimicrobiia bacterium]